MDDRLLSRPHTELAYEESGAGPVLGYAHGMLLSRAADDRLGLSDWAPVTGQRRLVRYDARAHGASTGRPVADDYTWSYLAGDLLAVADLVAPGRPVDWVGASMGCGTLLWAATQAPQRFRRLVLEIPPTTGETRVAVAGTYRTSADIVERDGLAAWLPAVRQYASPPIFDDVPSFQMSADVTEALLPSVLRGAAATDLPDPAALAALPHPTLILSWETDPAHPVSTAELLTQTLPAARLHVSTTSADVRTWPDRIARFLNE